MKTKNALKMTVLYFYMYFVGPLIWGGWMTYRLKIISLQEYLHCLISLPVILMLVLYFFVNTVSAIKFLNKAAEKTKQTGGRTALRLNSVSVISFGTAGTFAFLSMLSTNGLSFNTIKTDSWVVKSIIGSMSGAALVFMFYIYFSTTLMTTLLNKMKETSWGEENETLRKLRRENAILYVLGLVMFVGSFAASLLYNGILTSGNFAASGGLLVLATLTFPVFMSWLLFRKSGRKIDRFLNPSDGAKRIGKKTALQYVRTFKYAVQGAAMLLFLVLLVTQNIRFWLILLIAGFASSLLFGRIYCGWLCPVNTLSGLTDQLFKRLRINRPVGPKWLTGGVTGGIVFSIFLGLLILSLVLRIRPQLFLILTLVGFLVSAVFASAIWCNGLCPWGTILAKISRFSLLRLVLGKEQCVRCGKCASACPSKALTRTPGGQQLDFSQCRHCLRCLDKCGKNAIVIQKWNPDGKQK